jgi:hypothetical protein
MTQRKHVRDITLNQDGLMMSCASLELNNWRSLKDLAISALNFLTVNNSELEQ